jgi:pilus assembly protein CpaF
VSELTSALPAQAWQHIRAGRRPDPQVLAEVAGAGRVTLGTGGAARLAAALTDSVWGAGALEPLLADPEVTDVAVNGDGSVWVDRGDGMVRVPVELGDVVARRALAVRLAAGAGRRLDEAAPFCDARLPSGVRLHAILPPLVPDGVHVTLRVPARRQVHLTDLVAAGSCSGEWARLLHALVARRVSFLVSGGTGAGKTTLLAALLAEVDPTHRLVVVEDVRELTVDHPHVVRLEGRAPNVEGAGAVSMVELVRQALRMRPDRIVVGEVRGGEVRELLAALNTGHEGGCGTLHANSPADVPARLEALGALAGLSPDAVHAQVLSAVQVVVHVCRVGRLRRVESISVASRRGPTGDRVEFVPAVRHTESGWPDEGSRHTEQVASECRGAGWAQLLRLLGRGDNEPSS